MNQLVLDPSLIKVIKVYKGAAATKRFGEKGKNGVLQAELQTPVALLRLNEVYDHFQVSKANRNLKVLLNKTVLVDPICFLADLRLIENVELIELDATSPVRWSFDENESYLNIITVIK